MRTSISVLSDEHHLLKQSYNFLPCVEHPQRYFSDQMGDNP